MVPIYRIKYGTSCKKPCDAIVAAESLAEAGSLLEHAVITDERIAKVFRTPPGLEIYSAEPTMFNSNLKGVIYFQ